MKSSNCLVFNKIPLRLIIQSTKPNPYIMLEDLSVKGFKVLSKPPEDYETSKLFAQRVARYHAVTYYMRNKDVS